MTEWWTYSLSDFLLFSPRTYYRLLELYNIDIWPAQIVALALGAVILALLRRDGVRQARVIAAILAGCWLWVAWAFHLHRYATINWAAPYFATGFAIEALLLLWMGLVRGQLRFRPGSDIASRVGLGIFIFALLGQPLMGPLLGRPWTQVEIFGVAPDPTAVATLGLLLTAVGRARWTFLLLPVLWCAVSGATLWTMESPDAVVPPLAAFLTLLLAARQTLMPGRQPATRRFGRKA